MFNITQYPNKAKVYIGPSFEAAQAYLKEIATRSINGGFKIELTDTFLTVYGEMETVFSIEAE